MRWYGEGSQDHREQPQGEALQEEGTHHQAQPFRPRPGARGRWIRSLREESTGVAQVTANFVS